MTLKSIRVFEHSDATFSPNVLVLTRVTVLLAILKAENGSGNQAGITVKSRN